MGSTDWGQTLKETLTANPGLTLGEVSKLASKAHHEKRQALATKTIIEGNTNPVAATKRKCVRWEYPGESKALDGLVGAPPAQPHPTGGKRIRRKGDVN